MLGLEFIQAYAPQVAPQTIQAIIRVESGGNPYAVGINGPIKLSCPPLNAAEAARIARYVIKLGYSVDLGLMQVNSRNLAKMGYTAEQMFDPRFNIQAGARILVRGYLGAQKHFGPGQDALRAALSAYNTGNYEAGLRNGYVAKYYRRPITLVMRAPVRKIKIASHQGISKPTHHQPLPVTVSQASDPYTANTTIFLASGRNGHE